MAECKHQWEQEGLIREKDRKGTERVVRSYRCQACGAICTDRDKAAPEGAKKVPELAPREPEVPAAPPVKEEAVAEKKKKKNGEPTGRKERSMADGWEQGKTYRQEVKRRKDGKKFTCTMQVMKGGFRDQDGHIWDSPTALTTAFMNKKVGVKGRRPAKAFFAEAPKAKAIQTRPDCNGTKKASKPAKKAPAKAPAKPAAKPSPAPKKAPTNKAREAKVEAPAPAASAAQELESLPEL